MQGDRPDSQWAEKHADWPHFTHNVSFHVPISLSPLFGPHCSSFPLHIPSSLCTLQSNQHHVTPGWHPHGLQNPLWNDFCILSIAHQFVYLTGFHELHCLSGLCLHMLCLLPPAFPCHASFTWSSIRWSYWHHAHTPDTLTNWPNWPSLFLYIFTVIRCLPLPLS